jgi:hypothetical protein
MQRAAGLFAALIAGAFLSAATTEVPPTRIHGTVKAFDGQYLTVKADSGKTFTVGLLPQTHIVRSHSLTFADLKPGDTVGTVAIRTADGKLRAQGVRLLPADSSELGQFPLGSNAARVVTNGTLSAVATTPQGLTLTLSFRGSAAGADGSCTGRASIVGAGCVGNAEVLVARGVPILAVSAGETTALLPGAIVSATVSSDVTSLLTALGITIEKDAAPAIAQ